MNLYRVVAYYGSTAGWRRSKPHSYSKCVKLLRKWSKKDPDAEYHILPVSQDYP